VNAACLRRTAATRAAKVLIRAAITAIHLARVARHPVWHARYVLARMLLPVPGRPDDGEELTYEEIKTLAAIVSGHPERSRT
jgi:hypothetical protein